MIGGERRLGGNSARRILLIEDDPTLGPAMLQRLRLEGFDPRLVTDGGGALREIAARPPDIVLSDMRLPDVTGEEVFRQTMEKVGLLPFYFMTAFGDVAQAVRLVQAGARDYLIKPIDVDALVERLNAQTKPIHVVPTESGARPLSDAMAQFEARLAKAARSDLPLLILGETGVGKERAARLAHAWSSRAQAAFVAINCGAIPRELAESMLFGHEKGAFTGAMSRMQGVCEEVGDGTLLLDEIAELPLELQPKLLRLIQERAYRPVGAGGERPFRGRIIAATHRDLEAQVRDGAFREDLYYRLAVVALTVPPLRDRPDEIVLLAHQILEAAVRRASADIPGFAFDDAAIDALRRHRWPGNVRELQNRVERAAALADHALLGVSDLFPDKAPAMPATEAVQPGSLDDAAEAAIRKRVREALDQSGGNQSEAARLLGVSRTTIWKYAKPG
jgi:DNA-binding NtrC family response regulator